MGVNNGWLGDEGALLSLVSWCQQQRKVIIGAGGREKDEPIRALAKPLLQLLRVTAGEKHWLLSHSKLRGGK